MVKRVFILFLVSLVLIGGCSKRRTRQFIAADAKTDLLKAGSWVISTPSVIAFKDVVDLKGIADTTMFWISMRAARPRDDVSDSATDIEIDSLKVSLLPDGGEYWRKPTRSAAYGSPDEKYLRKAFDFFGDQGIVIPAEIWNITVQFVAVAKDESGDHVGEYPLEIHMIRDEKALKVPLLQQ
ncbi:MAG: hypothetical protein JSV52_00665 [Candidatus Zixiibacteriota bacterium]|nr:MAG: hypothetical protein JSV52_00665 [candidate division Zixibacteria bacterium]